MCSVGWMPSTRHLHKRLRSKEISRGLNNKKTVNLKPIVMNRFNSILLSIAVMAGVNAWSQTSQTSQPTPAFHNLVAFSWEISVPTDNDYLNEESLSGWRLEYRKMIKSNFSVGLAISWNAFDEYVNTKTYTRGSSAVTTDMVRQIYTVPMTAIGHYYLKTNSTRFQPYLGIGLGAEYADMNSYLNIYEVTEDNWGFVVRPEIGTLIHLGAGGTRIILTAGYNIATNKYDAFDLNSLK